MNATAIFSDSTTGFKTDFEARSSEKFVVKARGGKGSEACRGTSRTFFADNADPRTSQPIAAGSSMETSCKATESPNDKRMWVQTYAVRILKRFCQRPTPLSLANTYLTRLKADLEVIYDDPIKRLSIEASY